MGRIAARSEPRRGREAFAKVDMAAYSQQVFGMFGGAVQPVRMRFARRLAGAVIDRFGRGLLLAPDGEEHFTVTAPVAVSPQFYAWLLGFGGAAELLGPAAAREDLRRHLGEAAKLYE